MNKFIDKDLYEEIKAGTNIISGDEYKQIVYAISQLASDMVVKTLGPYGKTTIIDDSMFSYPSKDGWAAISRLRFSDPIYNTIFNTIKQISFSVVNKVGDGTTSALVGANAFLKEVLEYQERVEMEGKLFRQSDFLKDLDNIGNEIIENLLSSDEVHKVSEDNFDEIEKIALISSNGNEELSKIIKEIYEKTGNPNIYVNFDKGTELSYDIETGYKFEVRALNHKAYINNDAGTCIKKDVETLIAIFDHNVTYNEHAELVSSLSKYASSVNKEIIIIAPYFDDIMANIIGTTIDHFVQQNKIPNIMLLQFPMSMEIHRKYLADVNMLTNAQIFDYGKVRAFNVLFHNATQEEKIEDSLLNVDQYNFESPVDVIEMCLGKTRTIVVAEKYAVLQDYEGIVNEGLFNSVLKEVEEHYQVMKEKSNRSLATLDKAYMDAHQRYIKLLGQMGTIKVGAKTELEKHFLKDSVDDATLACRSAYENGYIKGLNLSTCAIIKGMLDKEEDESRRNILNFLLKVFSEMSLSVMDNKVDRAFKRDVSLNYPQYNAKVSYKLDSQGIIDFAIENKYGYNLVTEEFEVGNELTVINSVSTDIEILKAMIGILSLILTSNQFLSMNRMYDRKGTHEQLMRKKKEERTTMIDNTIDALLTRKTDIGNIVRSSLTK